MVEDATRLAERFGELAVAPRDRSSTLFTTYEPGFEGTLMIHGRAFAPVLFEEAHRYFLPIDGNEYYREQLTMALWLTIGKSVLPPQQMIPHGTFLDLGTGFGLWAYDVGFLFPDHELIGLDLQFTQAPMAWDNCKFERDDYELPFTPRDEPVALVHLRDSYLSVRDFDKLAQEIFDALCNGGWFQNQEMRLQNWVCNKPNFNSWLRHTITSARNLGIQLHSAQDVKRGLSQAGFCHYAEHKAYWQASRTTETGRQLREVVKLTVMGSVGILAQGESGLDITVPALIEDVLKELDEDDCEVFLEADTYVARKGSEGVQPEAAVMTSIVGVDTGDNGSVQNWPKAPILDPPELLNFVHQEGTFSPPQENPL